MQKQMPDIPNRMYVDGKRITHVNLKQSSI